MELTTKAQYDVIRKECGYRLNRAKIDTFFNECNVSTVRTTVELKSMLENWLFGRYPTPLKFLRSIVKVELINGRYHFLDVRGKTYVERNQRRSLEEILSEVNVLSQVP